MLNKKCKCGTKLLYEGYQEISYPSMVDINNGAVESKYKYWYCKKCKKISSEKIYRRQLCLEKKSCN